jgi:hypothetical protein
MFIIKTFAQHSFAASGGYALNPSAVFQLKFGGSLQFGASIAPPDGKRKHVSGQFAFGNSLKHLSHCLTPYM